MAQYFNKATINHYNRMWFFSDKMSQLMTQVQD
jgi:hypothetical protein